MQVVGPKGPYPQLDLVAWAQGEIAVAKQIVDNPGGGLLFATQTMGQVRSALTESDQERWKDVIAALEAAESSCIWRDFEQTRSSLELASSGLTA
ncbi:MAG TPA: hypothetical protein VNI34_02125 [Candidatus Nitrosotalea sp.]|nr:hypothetical protein [Candidatus Nitrosotalea sp.]